MVKMVIKVSSIWPLCWSQRKPRPGIRGSGTGASLVRTIAVEPGKTVRYPLLPLAWEKLSGGLARPAVTSHRAANRG
jgi:hypothetical protein